MTFVDTNILIDIVAADPSWQDWSARALDAAFARGPTCINAIVYAEFAASFSDAKRCDEELENFELVMAPISKLAAFYAAQAFKAYRLVGGARGNVLPDFFIGAHASDLGATLLTRDVRRYRTYFPKLILITPNVA